ncbi:MAG: RNA polymerase sigma factor [Microcoleus sp.]
MKLNCQGSVFSRERHEDTNTVFWSLWQQNQDRIYRCCLKWMNNNPTDAEDALSRVMLKAWEKVHKHPGEITNFQAWLTRLTRNLCIDIHRSCERTAKRFDSLEAISSFEEIEQVSLHDTPLSALEKDEKKIVIRRAIDNLPAKMRETFVLHFYQELSYQEIAQQQEISYQNVCKRISQARAILRKQLRGYWLGDGSTDMDEPPNEEESTNTLESSNRKESKNTVRVESIENEIVTLSEKIQEVAIVANAEPYTIQAADRVSNNFRSIRQATRSKAKCVGALR